ncbi:hypothetical protein ACFLRY_00595 [Bacteroidota bacterium]
MSVRFVLKNIMRFEIKREIKIWMLYFLVIFCSAFLHEIGHCIPAWIYGYKAIPTPAMEYISDNIPQDLEQYIALGGVLVTLILALITILLYTFRNKKTSTTILAGVLAIPAIYTLRFLILGRGHDATEFQEAQAALGLSYSGHSIDWLFLSIFIFGVLIWIIKAKPGYRIIGRLLVGAIFTIIFIVALQEINNAVFDPMFG